MTTARAAEIFARLAAETPKPATELIHTNSFTLLVAVVLSAQATDVGVNRASKALFAAADSPEKMCALGEEGVARHIRSLGLWRNKSRNVVALSKRLLTEFDGHVPNTRDDLMSLPGVGPKTANVVLNEAFGVPTIAVDTHVFRLANRTALASADTPGKVEKALMRVTPARYLGSAHHWLILHGRHVCKARKPLCNRCVIADLCPFPNKTV